MKEKKKIKARAASHSDNRQMEHTPWKCFRCGPQDNLISKFPKPPKDNEIRQKQVRSNDKGNPARENGENNSDQKIYASMACTSGNDECPSRNFGDSSQLTNWILDSVVTCHMTPEVSDFIPGSLEDTDKNIEGADLHHVTAKQKWQARITMSDDHGYTFIATLHNVLLAPYSCDRLF